MVLIRWVANADDPITEVRILHKEATLAGSMTLIQVQPDAEEYVLSDLQPNTRYRICVEYITESTRFYPVQKCQEVRTAKEREKEPAAAEKSNMLYIIIGAAAGGALIIILLIIIVCILCRRKRNRDSDSKSRRRDPEGRRAGRSGYLHENAYSSIEDTDNFVNDRRKQRDNNKGKSESKSHVVQNGHGGVGWSAGGSAGGSGSGGGAGSPPASPTSRYRNVREIETVFMRASTERLDEIISQAESDGGFDDPTPKFKTIKSAKGAEISAIVSH